MTPFTKQSCTNCGPCLITGQKRVQRCTIRCKAKLYVVTRTPNQDGSAPQSQTTVDPQSVTNDLWCTTGCDYSVSGTSVQSADPSVSLMFYVKAPAYLCRRTIWNGFWPCSGRLEVMVLYVVLSLLAQFAFWSRIVDGLNQDHV